MFIQQNSGQQSLTMFILSCFNNGQLAFLKNEEIKKYTLCLREDSRTAKTFNRT